MEGMLGGDGKVVEIDEVFLSKRKYNKGRMPAEGQVIVFGMTELEEPLKQVQDPALLRYLIEKEGQWSAKEAALANGPLRQPHERRRPPDAQQQRAEQDGVETFVTEGDFTRVMVWEDEDNGEEVEFEESDEEDAVQQQQPQP